MKTSSVLAACLALGTAAFARLGRDVTHRELKSDLLLVKPVGGDRWMPFRDVFDVDDKPVRGRFWIEPDTGRVIASELIAEDTAIKGTVDVQYQAEPSLGLLVPIEMRERYDIRRDSSRVDGTATYGRFRQFQVKVDEKLAPVVKQ